MVKKIILSGLTALFLFSCQSKSGLIKPETDDRFGFRFFLFASFADKEYRGSGEAYVWKDKDFRFRLYDNLLNRHLFDFIADSGGSLKIIIPEYQLTYRKKDPVFADTFTRDIPVLFRKIAPEAILPEMTAEGPWVRKIRKDHSGTAVIEVLKWNEDGSPRRIKISGEDSGWLVLDVLEYLPFAGRFDETVLPVEEVPDSVTFFQWIGEWNEQR